MVPHQVREGSGVGLGLGRRRRPRLIKSSGAVDLEISKIEYDLSLFRLEVRNRCSPFLGELTLTVDTYKCGLSMFIRDAGADRQSREVDEIHRSIERMCWHCIFAEQESNHECANRELVTGQVVTFEGTSLNSPRRVAARAAAKARIEADGMTGRQTDRHMRCQLLKASLWAGMPTSYHWGVEPVESGRTPRKPAWRARSAASRVGSLRSVAPMETPPPYPTQPPPPPSPESGDIPPPPP